MFRLLLFQIILLGIASSQGKDCNCEPCKNVTNGDYQGGWDLMEENSTSCPKKEDSTKFGCLYSKYNTPGEKMCFCDPGSESYDTCFNGTDTETEKPFTISGVTTTGLGQTPTPPNPTVFAECSAFSCNYTCGCGTCKSNGACNLWKNTCCKVLKATGCNISCSSCPLEICKADGCVSKCLTVACSPTKGKIEALLPKLGKAFHISFSLTINETGTNSDSVIQFTTGKNETPYGSRIPAVWVNPEGHLLIYFDIDGKTMQSVVTPEKCPLGVAIPIEISQASFKHAWLYVVKVNGTVIKSHINTDPQQFLNVLVYLSNPWDTAAKACVTDLCINPTNSTKSC